MDEHQIKQALEQIANEQIGDDMNLWPELERQLDQKPRWKPRTRLGWATAMVALFIMASATVYAVDQLLQGDDPGIEAVSEEITYFDLTQQIPGETGEKYNLNVTLNYAYADANRITISYGVTGEAKASEALSIYHTPSLMDDRGNQFVWLPIGGGGGGGGGGSNPDEIVQSASSMTTSFDASLLTDTPEELNLTLKIEVAYSTAELARDNPMGMILAGETTFNFTLPLNPGRVMVTPQTVTAGGIDMTVQKVVVAPSLTRIELCYTDPEPDDVIWQPYGRLEIAGEEILPESQIVTAGLAGLPLEETDPCRALIIPQALQEENGEWTLTITNLTNHAVDRAEVIRRLEADYGIVVTVMPDGGFSYDTSQHNNFGEALFAINNDLMEHIDGPWVFTFTLP